MRTLAKRENGYIEVKLNNKDFINLIQYYNDAASVEAIENVTEDDSRGSLAIYKSYNTLIGGAILAFKDMMNNENVTKIFNTTEDVYKYLLAKQKEG